ncbi:MAG: endolytic transglycosylase MltG [Gammaproteobacteria bacterium WSBS_2016_MAG_OTU1]
MKKVVLWLGSLAVLAIAAGAGWTYYQKHLTATIFARQIERPIGFNIPRGASLRDIAEININAGAPISITEFIILAQKLQIAAKLQAGRYQFAKGDTMRDVLVAIAEGKVAPAERITIIEGTSYRDLRELLKNDIRLKKILAGMDEAEIRRTLQIKYSSLEGIFLPETYFFTPGDSDLDILKRAYQSMEKTLQTLWEKHVDKGIIKTPYEALVLASIVEKETGAAEERPLIASVFINRLRKGIRLQADPTVIYGLGTQFDGNLTRPHLRDKNNVYNTYMHRGLTPTPIALPGKAAIDAVLNPADTDLYYFVASGGGRHVFSKTLREHNNAVNKYQRRRKK